MFNLLWSRAAQAAVATFAVGASLTVCVPLALADDRILSVGQYAFDSDSNTVRVQSGDTFLVDLAANRSYVCEAFASQGNTNFDWSTTVVGTGAAAPTVTAEAIGDVVPIAAGELGGIADNRIAMTPTVKDRYRLTVQNAASGGENVRMRCLATTLFGSFNTVANDLNYLELSNLGNQAITVVVSAVSSDGSTAINAVPYSIPSQRRFDVNLHEPIGAGKYGFVRVTHNAPLGTLQGVVSQYQTSGSTFALTATIPLTTLDPRP